MSILHLHLSLSLQRTESEKAVRRPSDTVEIMFYAKCFGSHLTWEVVEFCENKIHLLMAMAPSNLSDDH